MEPMMAMSRDWPAPKRYEDNEGEKILWVLLIQCCLREPGKNNGESAQLTGRNSNSGTFQKGIRGVRVKRA